MFEPGTIPWFLRHELKVTWRTWFQRGKRRERAKRRLNLPAPLVAGAILLLATIFVGVPVANALRDTVFEVTPIVAFIVDAALLLIFTLMLSQTLVAAVDVFYERGDLDLLLSSPVPPRRILTVRALAMALNPALIFGALAVPFVIPMSLLGHAEMLAVLVVLGCLSLASTAIGLAIAIALFSSIGPRRTRTVAQVLAAVVGAAFVLAAQIPNILDNDESGPPTAGFFADLMERDTLPSLAMWPAQAALGSFWPLVVFVAAALGVFALVATRVGNRFARDAAAASGADAGTRRTGREDARFGASVLRATIAKELRMLFRDPGLLSQVLLRVFYVIPLAIVILTEPTENASFIPAIVAGGASLLAGQLAGSVAWIAISAEDSPQLLASAPYPMRVFWRAKLMASMLFPAVAVVPLMIAYAFFEPLAALIGLAGAAGAAWSAAMINLWLQKPSKRADFRRSWSSTLGANLLELLSSFAFAAAAGMAAAGLGYFWIALAVAAAIILLTRRSEDAIRERMAVA